MTERKRFENWLMSNISLFSREIILETDDKGDYTNNITYVSHRAWQAAKAEQAAEVEWLREALQQIVDYGDSQMPGTGLDPNAYDDKYIIDIRGPWDIAKDALSQSRSETSEVERLRIIEQATRVYVDAYCNRKNDAALKFDLLQKALGIVHDED